MQSGKWRIKNRLQTSYEFDDNIRENPSDSIENVNDSSLRVIFNSQAAKTTANSGLNFTYRGGLQSYFKNSIENKLINEAQFSASYKLGKSLLGVRGQGRLKLYLNDILDYSMGGLELFFRPPNISTVGNEFSVSVAALDYQNFPAFNYSLSELRWTISKKLNSKMAGALVLSGKRVNYDRSALSFNPVDSLRVNNFAQQDHLLNSQIQINYTRPFLLNLKYNFQYNHSNSFGYSYFKHQLVLILGYPLTTATWFRGYAAIQFKNYEDSTIAIFPTDIDTEREESNLFVIDISRDLKPSLTALIRFAYYNNESVIRGQFYNKFLITTGIDFRF